MAASVRLDVLLDPSAAQSFRHAFRFRQAAQDEPRKVTGWSFGRQAPKRGGKHAAHVRNEQCRCIALRLCRTWALMPVKLAHEDVERPKQKCLQLPPDAAQEEAALPPSIAPRRLTLFGFVRRWGVPLRSRHKVTAPLFKK